MNAPARITAASAETLAQRAHACADLYLALGRNFSAGWARDFAHALERGAPACLYAHFIAEQEERAARIAASEIGRFK